MPHTARSGKTDDIYKELSEIQESKDPKGLKSRKVNLNITGQSIGGMNASIRSNQSGKSRPRYDPKAQAAKRKVDNSSKGFFEELESVADKHHKQDKRDPTKDSSKDKNSLAARLKRKNLDATKRSFASGRKADNDSEGFFKELDSVRDDESRDFNVMDASKSVLGKSKSRHGTNRSRNSGKRVGNKSKDKSMNDSSVIKFGLGDISDMQVGRDDKGKSQERFY
jgi:hypothetical protein